MHLAADEDANRRRAGQAVAVDVPAGFGEHVLAGGRERGDVRHLAAGHERERCAVGDAEQLLQPRARDLLDDRCRWTGYVQAGVLIPGGGEPVGGERSRDRAADHEAEVATAWDGDHTRVDPRDELLDHARWVRRLLGQRPSEQSAQLLGCRLREHRPLVERLEELRSEVGGASEQFAGLVDLVRLDHERQRAALRGI